MPGVSSLIWAAALAASPPPAGDPLVGRWHGTSLCQVKPSPCHDEEVVYHISRKTGGGYSVAMSKVVAGTEQEMGAFDATFSPATGTLAGITVDRRGAPGRWVFRLRGDRLSGRLVVNGSTMFRRIEVGREAAPAR
ncbi:MAG: hypothetical protein QOJ27_1035 [Sphingomonadales bacterium]|nr:hypothetical protein [Sphingomonadales bacterium]